MLTTTIKYLQIFERIRKFYTWMYPFKIWKYTDKFYPRTSKNVLSLVFRINNQIKLSEVEDKKEILRKRVNCLSGRKTTVYLGEHLKNSKGITKDRLLSTVGILKSGKGVYIDDKKISGGFSHF